jgi:1-aminocyclopropane-1-carboxylate deaminase/D-cysteine desulfhydrase-like pyridoxal-dependent ACC family enzyme
MNDGGGSGHDPFTLPLLLRYPSLAWVPRVRLGAFPTPVERLPSPGGELWVKRDDRSGTPLGGNKVRSLEFLLAGIGHGDEIVTTGARGSTHALATAVYGRALGARVTIVRWPQVMNAEAYQVAAAIRSIASETHDSRTIVSAIARAAVLSFRRGARWVPPGGTSARGALGHVNAALELAEQVAAGRLPRPARIVVPLGSGGTAGGLALGLAIAGMETTLSCAVVAPRVVANKWRVMSIARRCARFIEMATGAKLPRPDPRRITVDPSQYGGAYGRGTSEGVEAARWMLGAAGIAIDTTYSSKACAAAMAHAASEESAGPTLFWLTYDARACVAAMERA